MCEHPLIITSRSTCMGTNNQFTWGLWSIIDILSVFFLFKYPTINIRVVQEKLFDINIAVIFMYAGYQLLTFL